MSTIKGIFEPFHPYVVNQLNRRKSILNSEKRDPKFFKLTTEKQCTIRMASGVDLLEDNAILETGEEYLMKEHFSGSFSGLARQYILEGGTQFYNIGGTHGGTREGFTQQQATPRTGHSYGDRNIRSIAQDGFGIVPMPGILDAEVNTKSEDGSLREARINFVCFNRRQLHVLEALYMRPGFPVLLEWGWVPYINEDGEIENDEFGFIEEFFDPKSDLGDLNKAIRSQKKESGGNYDGFIGYIKNFSFKVREDGGYDCVTELIAHGELLEALTSPTRLVPKGLTYDTLSGMDDQEYSNYIKQDYRVRVDYEPIDDFLYYMKSIKANLDKAGDAAMLSLEGTTRQNVEEEIDIEYTDEMYWSVQEDVFVAHTAVAIAAPQFNLINSTIMIGRLAYNIVDFSDGKITIEVVHDYVDDHGRKINIKRLNEVGKDMVEGFEDVKIIVSDVSKIPIETLNKQSKAAHIVSDVFNTFDVVFEDSIYNMRTTEQIASMDLFGNEDMTMPSDRLGNPGATDRFDNTYYGDVQRVQDQIDFERRRGIKDMTLGTDQDSLMGNHLGFYSLLNNTILKEVVAKPPEFEGDEDVSYNQNMERDDLYDTGWDQRIFIRWDLICQIFNRKIITQYKDDTPLAELTYLHPNQPTYSNIESNEKINNSTDSEHPNGYEYIKYSAPKTLPKLFPGESGMNDYPPTLGVSYDLNVCIMPHQLPHFRRPNVMNTNLVNETSNLGLQYTTLGVRYEWDGTGPMPDYEEIRENMPYEEEYESVDIHSEELSKNFTSFKNVSSDNNSIGLVYFNLDHVLKSYEEAFLEEYKTVVGDKTKYRRRKNKKFNLHDWITSLWNDANEACGGYYDFGLHTEHERPHVARIVDFTLSGRPTQPIYEFNPQGLDSVARDSFVQSKLDNDFASAISIAAQSPDNIDSLDAVSFKAFRKNIKSRFTTSEFTPEEKLNLVYEAGQQYEYDLKAYADTLRSLGFYLRKMNSSNYHSELAFDSTDSEDTQYIRKPITPDTAKQLAASIESQRIKLLSRYPRYKENTNHTPYYTVIKDGDELVGNAAKDQSKFKGGYRDDISHYRNSIIPLTTTILLDGISGMVPLQIFKIQKNKLPLGYQRDDIVFIVKSEKQKVTSGQDWTTTITGHLSLLDLNDDVNVGNNNLEEEPIANTDALDAIDEMYYANELRLLLNKHGHIEKINIDSGVSDIDSAGDIDPKIVEFMKAFLELLDAVDDDGNSRWFKDFPDCPDKPPFQKLIITAGNDLFHAQGGGSGVSKHKDGLALDFRLVNSSANQGLANSFGIYHGGGYSDLDSPSLNSGHDNYRQLTSALLILWQTVLNSSFASDEMIYYTDVLKSESSVPPASTVIPDLSTRGSVVRVVLDMAMYATANVGKIEVVDHYTDCRKQHCIDYWGQTPQDHFHIEFDDKTLIQERENVQL